MVWHHHLKIHQEQLPNTVCFKKPMFFFCASFGCKCISWWWKRWTPHSSAQNWSCGWQWYSLCTQLVLSTSFFPDTGSTGKKRLSSVEQKHGSLISWVSEDWLHVTTLNLRGFCLCYDKFWTPNTARTYFHRLPAWQVKSCTLVIILEDTAVTAAVIC